MAESSNFQPHPLIRGGHLQTLAGFYWPTPLPPYQAKMELLEVPGDDKIALHDDCPPEWTPTDRVALLIHGLAGCHGSGYVVRLADRLTRSNIRCFRMDMRGTGAASGHAKLPGHAGRTEDVTVAINTIADRCPHAPMSLVGFSMGGNLALNMMANASQQPVGNLDHCIAVSPPVDLSKCCRELRTGSSAVYDKYLIYFLLKIWQRTGGEWRGKQPRSIYEFDDLITAPLSGYRDAEDYYAQCSSGPRLPEITLPTTILAAKDDPLVASSAIADAELSPSINLVMTDSGGHLGYFSRRQHAGDGRWMDWQLCDWIIAR